MIQLYENNTQDISKNGIILTPIECKITPKLNDTNELELIHEIDKEGVYKKLQSYGGLIKVPTPDFEEDQLYRIYDYQKDSENKTITVYARHVFFDLAKKIIFNKSITGTNGQVALNRLLEDTNFTGYSNINKQDIRQYKTRTVLNAISGDEEDSFLSIFGGEIECNNYDLTINEKRGADRGIRVSFGYNLKSIQEDISWDEVVTRIYPYSGDINLGTNTPYVDSPLISKYPDVYEQVIEMSDITVKEVSEDADGNEFTDEDDTGYDTIEEARQAMIDRCNKLYNDGADKITANYKVDMVSLRKTTAYKELGYDIFETIKLGDTVHCYNKNIDIEVDARCISYTWNCISEEYEEIELGQFISGYVDQNLSKLDNLYRQIILKEQNILLKVTALDNSTSASIELLKDAITATVEGIGASSSTEWKLGSITNTVVEDGYQSQLRQSSRSIRIAWNKISNYAEIDDSIGLILGNQDDGTYSQIGYDGRLAMKMNGVEKPYHCLMYEGSAEISCSDDDYTEWTKSLPSMFDGINDDDIKVAVAIKKVYKDGYYMPYWFGAYGEIVNGDIVIKAMSAWRRYSTYRAVTDIDLDYTDGYVSDVDWDRDYFVSEFESPVGGNIIVQYIVMA
nr:MAG TPA: tail protein [Caudoviricetes sp.]